MALAYRHRHADPDGGARGYRALLMIVPPHKLAASDARAIMADDGTKTRRALIERLVLDWEGIDDHRQEQPDPWHVRHDEDVTAARAAYALSLDTDLPPAEIVESPDLTFLVAHVHTRLLGIPVLFRPHWTLRAYHTKAGTLDRAWRARANLTAFCCRTGGIWVVDYWNGLTRVPDRLETTPVAYDHDWVTATVLPRIRSAMEAVSAQLATRKAG